MVDELFTTPRSPIFAICTLDFIWRIKVTKHVLKPTSKGICDNLSMRIDMECGDQVCNALLYHLSTSILVNENGCSGGLALTVHNLLIWVYRLILIIRNPGIRRVRLDFFLSIDLSSEGVEDAIDPALELKLKLLSSIDASGSHPLRLMAQDSAIALSSCLRSSSLMSSSFWGGDKFPWDCIGGMWFHWIDRCSQGSTSWWIERSPPQQSLECELSWLMKDFCLCDYEETYAI